MQHLRVYATSVVEIGGARRVLIRLLTALNDLWKRFIGLPGRLFRRLFAYLSSSRNRQIEVVSVSSCV
jgi:hypothetical protein